jgi:hypothetical protein
MAQAVIVHVRARLVTHVEERDGRRQEGVLASKDMEGRDADDLADLISQLRDNFGGAVELEGWSTRDKDRELCAGNVRYRSMVKRRRAKNRVFRNGWSSSP